MVSASVYFSVNASDDATVWLWPFGILGGLAILAAGVVGFRRGVEKARKAVGMPPGELRRLVESRELGFWVCTRCRVVMPRNLTGDCLECGSGVDCLQVASEDERRIALAAIPRSE